MLDEVNIIIMSTTLNVLFKIQVKGRRLFISIYLEHVVLGSSVVFSHGVPGLLREIEVLSPDSPSCHNALALLEVPGHVGSVALVARVDVVLEGLPRAALVVVTLVQHHVVHVSLVTRLNLRDVTHQVVLA